MSAECNQQGEYPRFDISSIETLLVVENVHSSNAKNRRLALDELQTSPYASKVVHMRTAGSVEARAEHLIETLDEGDALITLGGEGTVNECASVLSEHFSGKFIPFLPLHGGNGNDGPLILNGRFDRQSPSQILRNASVVPIHPLEGAVTDETGSKRKWALLYAGIGGTARAAWELNQLEYRGQPGYDNSFIRRLLEARQAQRVLPSIETFRAERGNVSQHLVDITAVNGPRMAKYLRWPVALQSREVLLSELESSNYPSLARWMGQNALAYYTDRTPPTTATLPFGAAATYNIYPDSNNPLRMHFDAEEFELHPGGSLITIQQAALPLYALSTRLRNPAIR